MEASPLLEQLRRKAAVLEERYGFTLHFESAPPSPDHRFFYEALDAAEWPRFARYFDIFNDELNKYPVSFFRTHGVRDIVLVKKLFANQKPAQGMYLPGYKRMYFDVTRHVRSADTMRHNIHHELYHMMAVELGGWSLHDPAWAALNDAGFTYGQDITRATINPINRGAPGKPGFVTYYAMTSIEEDRAETFAALMIPHQHRLITRWAERDPVLKRKMERMKEFVAGFEPEMDEGFWRALVQP
jgi:hypothetical protein